VGLPNSGKSALLAALSGAAAVVAPYPHSTLEPALGPLEDADGNLYLVADLPGLAADGTPRRGAHLDQLERARVLLHCVDASGPEPVDALLERARPALRELAPPGVRELVVATRADPAAPPEGADLGVDLETGAGVEDVRERVIAELTA
jgi:GTPase involved in cell partitioning and DNA repair